MFQKLRLALQQDVKEIFKEASKILDLDVGENTSELIAEFAWRKLILYASDLEQFAKYFLYKYSTFYTTANYFDILLISVLNYIVDMLKELRLTLKM